MSTRRLYRQAAGSRRFKTFTVTVKETDLWIAMPPDGFNEALPGQIEQLVWRSRRQLESYIEAHPEFAVTREPYLVRGPVPGIVLSMARAGNIAGVGPMAAVAGALAEIVGRWLLQEHSEVIVENGGDIFMKVVEAVKVAVLAGKSPLSNKIALLVDSDTQPCGICALRARSVIPLAGAGPMPRWFSLLLPPWPMLRQLPSATWCRAPPTWSGHCFCSEH